MKLLFLPCTREIEIARGVRYRPIRSWHVGTFAGEGLTEVGGDRSGCMETINGREYAPRPYTAIHRVYWHPRSPKHQISAFLSYPGQMGSCPEYFWEARIETNSDGIERFTGENAEAKMETAIVRTLLRRVKNPPRSKARKRRRP